MIFQVTYRLQLSGGFFFFNILVLFYHTFISNVACPAGYFGENCSKPCPLERYGPGCIEKCTCPYCHPVYGCNERNGKNIREFRSLAIAIFFYKYKIHIGLNDSNIINFNARDSDTGVSKIDVNAKRPTETMIHVVIVIKRTCNLHTKDHHLRLVID